MCTGFELAAIAGAGLSTVGSVVGMSEQNANMRRAADARNNELNRTLLKNDSLADQSRDEFAKRQQGATNEAIEKDRQDATDQRTSDLTQAVDSAPQDAVQGESISGSAPTVVKSDLAKRMSEALGKSKDQAQKLGALGGYGDSWLNQGLADQETGRNLQVNANRAAGNMSILPAMQDIAETRSQKPISPFGAILQGAGSMLGSYGGSHGGGGVPKKSITTDPWAGMRRARMAGGWL